jgi:gliding motility-associated-like protein
MKITLQTIIILFAFSNNIQAQCPSELLFLKAPDTICAGSKEFVLQTSIAPETGAIYIWFLPNGRDSATTEPLLRIREPTLIHSGNYRVASHKNGCSSAAIGPLAINVLGTPFVKDTVKTEKLCGITEKKLSSKYKTSSAITGEWSGTEGVLIVDKFKDTTRVKNLNVGKNTFIWTVSTAQCKAFLRDTFNFNVEVAPQMDVQNLVIDAKDASLTIPLGALNGSNINFIEDLSIQLSIKPKPQGTVNIEGVKLKYGRKIGYRGNDSFSIKVCNKRCPVDLCSKPINFTIKVDYNEQYPNVTIPRVLSPQQDGTPGFVIDGVEKYPDNELIILDRWGTVLKTFPNYPNPKEGLFKGEKFPTGAYYFVFRAIKDNQLPPKTNFKPLTGIFYILD